MNPCNTCRVFKLPQDFPMTIYGYRRHVCTLCYADFLDQYRGQCEDRRKRLMEGQKDTAKALSNEEGSNVLGS